MGSSVVDLVVVNLAAIIKNESSLIGGVRDELDELEKELKYMKSSIKDAEERNGRTAVEAAWVADVVEMCYTVEEEIIDEFMYHLSERRKHANFLKRIFQLPNELRVRHRLANKIQETNKKLKSIQERFQRYGVPQIGGKSSRKNQNTNQRRVKYQSEALVYAKSDRFVGIDDDWRRLEEEWLNTGERELTIEEQKLTIISIVGMGGSGKTILADKAYKSLGVKRSFECYAWITVSQTYEIKDLLRRMIEEFYSSQKKEVPKNLGSLKFINLSKMLVDYLKPKRYIVVLDDVWDMNLWKDMKISFPEEEKGRGSRVILTTRNENIATASYGVRKHIHHIKPLKHKEAWELFCSRAFISSAKRVCPKELNKIARDLLRTCGGLPLAITTLGGALSSKKLLLEWIQFRNSLNHQLSNNDNLDEVKNRILLFSFKDLSYELKRCFLYCCLFPEDYPFKRKRLIRLWMAEGFVKPEFLADDYLLQLVHRNMLQVVTSNESGRPKSCKMHGMMRELALSMSANENFCSVYDGEEGNQERRTRIHRLSIHKKLDNATRSLSSGSVSLLRSLLVFATDMMRPSSAVKLLSAFRLLRVLDLENLPIEKLSDKVVHLFSLRYMNLRNTKVKELPKRIGNLRYLQTLDTRDSLIKEFPAELLKLENLQYLIMYRYDNDNSRSKYDYVVGTTVPSNICKLKNLQVLACVKAEPKLMMQLKYMTQLTRIGITNLKEENETDLGTAIDNMNHLRYMLVMASDKNKDLPVKKISSVPPCLKTLILVGKLANVPSWLPSLQCLTFLVLNWSRLDEDLLPHIQQLPNLGRLVLENAYTGDQLSFSEGFEKLTKLNINNFTQLKKIIINQGVMPGLKLMSLKDCKQLKMVPQGIEHLTQLEELNLVQISTELVGRIRGKESTDRRWVRHIPVINNFDKLEDVWVYESLSRSDIDEELDD